MRVPTRWKIIGGAKKKLNQRPLPVDDKRGRERKRNQNAGLACVTDSAYRGLNFRLRRRLSVGLTSESSGHLSNSDCTRQSRSCLKYTHNIHFNHHTKKCILVAVFYSVWESCKPPDQSCPTCTINDIVKMKRMRNDSAAGAWQVEVISSGRISRG